MSPGFFPECWDLSEDLRVNLMHLKNTYQRHQKKRDFIAKKARCKCFFAFPFLCSAKKKKKNVNYLRDFIGNVYTHATINFLFSLFTLSKVLSVHALGLLCDVVIFAKAQWSFNISNSS